MSKSGEKIQLPADGHVEAALKAIRGEGKDGDWLVIGYADKSTLCVVASGSGGLGESKQHLVDGEGRYVLFRKDVKVEMAKTVKFVLIDWTPDTVSPLRRALLSTHKGQIQDLMKPYHVSVQAVKITEVDEADVLHRIDVASGIAVHVTTKVATGPTSPTHRTVPSDGGAERKASSFAPSSGKPASFVPSSDTGSKVEFQDADNFKSIMSQLRNSKSDVNWVLVSYAAKDKLAVLGSGNGTIEQALELAQDDNVNFGLIRMQEQIDKSLTTKFIYFKWQPDSVAPTKKAYVGTKKGAIDAFFAPYHLDFVIGSRSDLTTDILHDKIAINSGKKSHVVAK